MVKPIDMKSAFIWALALATALACSQAHAQQSVEEKEKAGPQILSIMIEQYVWITAGNYLESRCRLLPLVVDLQFNENVDYISAKMKDVVFTRILAMKPPVPKKKPPTPAELVRGFDEAAKEAVKSTACDEKGKNIVMATFNKSGSLRSDLDTLEQRMATAPKAQ